MSKIDIGLYAEDVLTTTDSIISAIVRAYGIT